MIFYQHFKFLYFFGEDSLMLLFVVVLFSEFLLLELEIDYLLFDVTRFLLLEQLLSLSFTKSVRFKFLLSVINHFFIFRGFCGVFLLFLFNCPVFLPGHFCWMLVVDTHNFFFIIFNLITGELYFCFF